MTRFRYPPRALAGDYLRAALGLGITGAPVLLLPTAVPVTVVLAGLSALFCFFGLRTALRQFTVVEMSDEAISVVANSHKRLAWREVRELRLDHYSIRRDGRDGWMQMRISGPGTRIRIESTLDGFDRRAARAASLATAHRVTMTDDTRGNFLALGIAVAPAGAEAAE
jgi:uncharacterized membrane protein